MKNAMVVLTGCLVTASSFLNTCQVQAGDREWATAGKVLTGVAAAHVLARAFSPPPVYQAPAPVYVTPAPVVVQQPPTVVVQQVQQPAPVVVQTTTTAPVIPNAPMVPAAPVAPAAPTVTTTTTSYVVQPVYVQPAPVYVAPAPVYVAPAYYAPPPVVSFGVHFGRGHYHRHGHGFRHGGWCW